jgi:hypothetical protein
MLRVARTRAVAPNTDGYAMYLTFVRNAPDFFAGQARRNSAASVFDKRPGTPDIRFCQPNSRCP